MHVEPSPKSGSPASRLLLYAMRTCAIAIFILLWHPPAMAQSVLRPAGEPIQRTAAEEAKRWTGHASYIFGYKKMSSDWAPADQQIEFGIFDIDFKRNHWPISIAGQVLLAYSSKIPGFVGSLGDYSGSYEFNLGLRKVWDGRPKFHPFLGAGVSLAGGSTTVQVDRFDYVQPDNDSGVGYWLGTGFYWKVSESFHTGLNVQYTRADITLFDRKLNAGGFHANILLGTSW